MLKSLDSILVFEIFWINSQHASLFRLWDNIRWQVHTLQSAGIPWSGLCSAEEGLQVHGGGHGKVLQEKVTIQYNKTHNCTGKKIIIYIYNSAPLWLDVVAWRWIRRSRFDSGHDLIALGPSNGKQVNDVFINVIY